MAAHASFDLTSGRAIDELPVGAHRWVDQFGYEITNPVGQPVAGVRVSLVDGDGAELARTITDADGSYHFDGLPAAEYSVVFTPPTGLGAVAPTRADGKWPDEWPIPTAIQTWESAATAGATTLLTSQSALSVPWAAQRTYRISGTLH